MKIKMIHSQKGFTFIELMVAITIMGILTLIIVGALALSKDAGRDASAIESLASLKAEAEIGRDHLTGLFLQNICNDTGAGGLRRLTQAAENVGASNMHCGMNADVDQLIASWGVTMQLNDGSFYCVDSNGFSGPTLTLDDIEDGYLSTDTLCDNL